MKYKFINWLTIESEEKSVQPTNMRNIIQMA